MAGEAARLVLPRVPDMLRNSFWHTLGYQPEKKWDLRTMLTITTIRGIMENSTSSITEQQNFSLKRPAVKANQLIVPVTMALPKDGEKEGGVRQALCRAIDEMKETGKEEYDIPTVSAVEGEWQAWTADRDVKKLAKLSDKERYALMMAEATGPAVVLYFHGGAYYLMDPASHRDGAARISREAGGRAFNVRYRMAPQNPFPTPILDAFVAYLSLLYPPPGAFHEPVKPEHIVFAGDSAGANLTAVLTLFLLHLHQTSQTTVLFHGKEVYVPLPGGLSMNSIWADVTRCMPSLQTNQHYDYLPGVTTVRTASTASSEPSASTGPAPKDPSAPPPCPLWPSPPPRADLYCSGTMLCHPLVSPLAATVKQWRGVPSAYFCIGEEMLLDECNVVASRVAAAQALDAQEGKMRKNVGVIYEGYEAMPHVFAMLLAGAPVSERCLASWAGFVKDVVQKGGVGMTKAVWITLPKLEEESRDFKSLSQYQDKDVKQWMDEERDAREKRWRERFEAEKDGGGR